MGAEVLSCLKGLPRIIKIGAYDWSLELANDDEDGEVNLGKAIFAAKQFKIWPANLTSPSEAVGTVLHEVLHAIHDYHGLDKLTGKRDDREEAIILGFEAGLISLFRDNPKLLTWFKKWL